MYEVDSYVFNSDGKEVKEKKSTYSDHSEKKIPIKYIEKKSEENTEHRAAKK